MRYILICYYTYLNKYSSVRLNIIKCIVFTLKDFCLVLFIDSLIFTTRNRLIILYGCTIKNVNRRYYLPWATKLT